MTLSFRNESTKSNRKHSTIGWKESCKCFLCAPNGCLVIFNLKTEKLMQKSEEKTTKGNTKGRAKAQRRKRERGTKATDDS